MFPPLPRPRRLGGGGTSLCMGPPHAEPRVMRLRFVSSPASAAQAASGLGALSTGAARLFPSRRVAWAARGLAHSPRARRAFSLRGERPGQPEAWRTVPRCGAPFPSVVSGSGSQRLGALFLGAARLFPPRPQRAPPGLRKSSDRNRGLFAGWEGVASLGLSLPLTPPLCLPPPAGRGRLFSAVSQSLCFANHRQCVPAG